MPRQDRCHRSEVVDDYLVVHRVLLLLLLQQHLHLSSTSIIHAQMHLDKGQRHLTLLLMTTRMVILLSVLQRCFLARASSIRCCLPPYCTMTTMTTMARTKMNTTTKKENTTVKKEKTTTTTKMKTTTTK